MNDDLKVLIDEAAAVLKGAGAREVYVFGSASKGELRDDSDVDFAVVGLPPQVYFKAMGEAEDVLRRPLDLVDLDEESPFVSYLKEEGELQRVA